jgi:hypothetical protein
MSEARKTWARRFAADETGFSDVLDTHEQHVKYLVKNRVANYLKKVYYPEHGSLNRKETFAKDIGLTSDSNLTYMARSNPSDFVKTVRGMMYFKSKRKSVSRDRARAKGEELK